MYMKHQRTLYLKRVSKENAKAKAKSPTHNVVDDAASNVSIESHVSLPVVILPLDPQLVDADDNLVNLGNIQNVDNIVEIQSQPEIPRDASCDLSHSSRFSEERSRKRFASSDSRRFASRDSPFPKRQGFASRDSPSPKRQRFASRDPPSPKRQRFASGDSPSPKRRRFASGDSDSPQRQHSSRASSGDGSLERPPSRSSPTRPSSPSREDKEADESSISAPIRAMIDFILKSFPDAQASPSHPLSRSFDLSAYAGITDAAIPPGSLLAWCHALSDAFSDTQQRFARRIKDGKVCHTLLPTLNRFERVSNSPTQGKELKANPDVCSDRILTCRIKSIRSPAKGGTGCYRFNYQPGS